MTQVASLLSTIHDRHQPHLHRLIYTVNLLKGVY